MDRGAHFFRCDLQVHTPRDLRWSGKECVSDDERRAYADTLVQACRNRGLQGIGITDHHDMLFASFIRRAAEQETDATGKPVPADKRLVVLPGMELTLGVPCQALILFDADFPDDLFPLVMNALGIMPSPSTDSRTAPIKRLDHIVSLRGLKEALDIHTWLRDRYIVLPNVTNEGKSSLLRTGLHGKYAEMPWVGGFVDGDVTKLTAGIQNILAGKDRNWGNKRLACFQTSDNRLENHDDLGKSSTWVKWAQPTAEALRQACLAQESRISQTEPRLPKVAIASISVSNSAFLGPIELELNPQYNALIGGRGTGKSTILEYLRWALCDQPPDQSDDDTPNYQSRRGRLIDATLRAHKATVDVRFLINDVPHLVRRNSEDGSILIKIAGDELKPCTETDVRNLLPIHAYSQKQLSGVSIRLDELSRFIVAPIRTTLIDVDRALSDVAGRIYNLAGVRARQRELLAIISERQLEEKSLTEQASALRAGLTGLSAEEQNALDQGKRHDAADRIVQLWRSRASALKTSGLNLRTTVDGHLKQLRESGSDPDGDLLKPVLKEYEAFLESAKISLDALVIGAASFDTDPVTMATDHPWRQWAEKLASVRDAYEIAVRRSSLHAEKLQQLKSVEQQAAVYARETARIAEEIAGQPNFEEEYQNERRHWRELLVKRDNLLEAECTRLTQSSNGAIRAKVKRFADASEFANFLKQSLSGSRISGAKIDALEDFITTSPDPLQRWDAALLDLERLAEFDLQRDGPDRVPPCPTLAAAGFTAGEINRLGTSLTREAWVTLSLTPIRSVPLFEYRAREGEYISFENASAGQQATALLKTLLNQEGPPLIIDQPEEDLDNPVMLEIVEQMWSAKQKRQLIFASHNANLVVNGDAELVAWCDYRAAGDQSRGSIAGQGAIDVADVRDAIKRIMEGGEAAFHLRKAKYGF